MALDTGTRKADPIETALSALSRRTLGVFGRGARTIQNAPAILSGWRGQHSRWGRFSLTRRILFVNLLAIAFLGAGMLYLDRYETGLIDTELKALGTQGGIFAAALSEGAVLQDLTDGPFLARSLAEGMVRRLTEPTRTQARVFLPNGMLIVDSRILTDQRGTILTQQLMPPSGRADLFQLFVDWLSDLLRARENYPPAVETLLPKLNELPEVVVALNGHVAPMVRASKGGGLILSVAVPVRRYKQVLGAVQLSVGAEELERQVNSVRSDILRLFFFGLIFTSFLSLYLASTIARPVRRLAQAAQDVRQGNGRKVAIPDFGARSDEIGELAVALSEMTLALWRRMDAIERFAADVSHEIKNPLSSLRSAVETAARITDPAQQRRLMAIIMDDVQRLDRLISDISKASRMDAEMSRLEREPVSLAGMLSMLVDMAAATHTEDEPTIVFRHSVDLRANDPIKVLGQGSRLVQVFQNLIANAVSFSPVGGKIVLTAQRQAGEIWVDVDDDGPGIPDGKLTAIFDRFYTERPAQEKFGIHSGLGLSISKQIIEAHGGRIIASNRTDAKGRVVGARFRVQLPEMRV